MNANEFAAIINQETLDAWFSTIGLSGERADRELLTYSQQLGLNIGKMWARNFRVLEDSGFNEVVSQSLIQAGEQIVEQLKERHTDFANACAILVSENQFSHTQLHSKEDVFDFSALQVQYPGVKKFVSGFLKGMLMGDTDFNKDSTIAKSLIKQYENAGGLFRLILQTFDLDDIEFITNHLNDAKEIVKIHHWAIEQWEAGQKRR